MKNARIGTIIGTLAVSMTACGIGSGHKAGHRADAPHQLNNGSNEVPSISEEDLVKMPRSFSMDESLQIPRMVLDQQLDASPRSLKFKSGMKFDMFVKNRAFICAMPDAQIANLLKAGIKDASSKDDKETLGAMLAQIFPSGQGHFKSSFEASSIQSYIDSDIKSAEDAALVRKFYCLSDEPKTYVEQSVPAFEALATPETKNQFNDLNLAQNVGVGCFIEARTSDRVSLTVVWKPRDQFVKERLPAMNIEWRVQGEVAKSLVTVIKANSPVTQDLAWSITEPAIYSANLSDASGRVKLTCARLVTQDDNSVTVASKSDRICGTHTEERIGSETYFVSVDNGFQFPARLKTYETTCGGSIEAYHTGCDAGEEMIAGSHNNNSEECYVNVTNCHKPNKYTPKICETHPELRHRNRGSVMCQNQSRAIRQEARTRPITTTVTVENTCEVPVRK